VAKRADIVKIKKITFYGSKKKRNDHLRNSCRNPFSYIIPCTIISPHAHIFFWRYLLDLSVFVLTTY